jgi:hypothetical protein
MKAHDFDPDKHFHYERQIPWDDVASELGVEIDHSTPVGYNWPQRWQPKLDKMIWKFYPRLTDGRHLEVHVADEEGNLEAEFVDVDALTGTLQEPIFPDPVTNEHGITRMIHRLGEIIVIAGGVHLKLLNGQTYPDQRNKPEDPGPALSVYCKIEPPEGDNWVSAIGYCCLENDPHMHLGEKTNKVTKDPTSDTDKSDSIAWCVRDISAIIVPLLEEAGFPLFAKTVSQEAIAIGMKEVEQAFRVPVAAQK